MEVTFRQHQEGEGKKSGALQMETIVEEKQNKTESEPTRGLRRPTGRSSSHLEHFLAKLLYLSRHFSHYCEIQFLEQSSLRPRGTFFYGVFSIINESPM